MRREAGPALVFASRTNRSSAKIYCSCQRAWLQVDSGCLIESSEAATRLGTSCEAAEVVQAATERSRFGLARAKRGDGRELSATRKTFLENCAFIRARAARRLNGKFAKLLSS